MKNITIYTTPTCSFCKAAKEFFKENKIEFSEIDITKDQKQAELIIKKTGQMGVPVIILQEKGNEEIIIGFDREKLISSLNIKT